MKNPLLTILPEEFEHLANAELEKNETVLNPNGIKYNLPKHAKTHKKGGAKVKLDSGSLVFSHHQKLDRTAKKNLGVKKKGKISFAEVTKPYDTHKLLKSLELEKDDYSKKTLELNTKRTLANLVNTFKEQESQKVREGKEVEEFDLTKSQSLIDFGIVKEPKPLEQYKRGGLFELLGDPYPRNKWVKKNLRGQYNASLFTFDTYNQDEYKDGVQRKTKVGYGINKTNTAQDLWLEHYAKGQSLQETLNKSYKSIFNQTYDFDAGKGTVDNKRGNITNRAPLIKYQDNASLKAGSITLDDYISQGSTKLGSEYGVSPDIIDSYFKPENNRYAYQLDLTKTEPEVRTLNESQPSEQLQGLENLGLPMPNTVIENERLESKPNDQLIVDSKIPSNGKISTEEVKSEVDMRRLMQNLQMNNAAFGLASVSRENPYYTHEPDQVVYNRFNPLNNLDTQRNFNSTRLNLENSDIPQSAANALIGSSQSALNQANQQLNLQNQQARVQLENTNSQLLMGLLNNNRKDRIRANYQYAKEDGQGRFIHESQKEAYKNTMFDSLDKMGQDDYYNKLLSQFSRNYNINNGDVKFEKGQGLNPLLLLGQ